MAEQKKMMSGLLQSAKVRIILFVVGIVAVITVVAVIWHQHNIKAVYQGAADIASAPSGISNTPGAGNPSDNYVKTQNIENAELNQQAKKQMTTSIPTITRPSFMDNSDAFNQSDDVFPTATAAASGPSCPALNTAEQMFRPNPANCTVPNLKLAREAGVTAQELRCQACSCPVLRAAGFTIGDLKDTGYSAENLKSCGFTLKQLMDAGYSASDLKNAGFSAEQLKAAGFTAAQLKDAGFTAQQLAAVGFTPSDLKNAGFSAKELAAAGFSPSDLKNLGFSDDEIKNAGFSAAQLKNAGIATMLPKSNGVCSVDFLRKARENGMSPVELKNRGCDVAAMKAAGFTAAELKAAGFSASDLKKAGYSAQDLHDAGFSAADLKAAGFSPKELHDVGYTADQLKAAGFSAADLKAAGFSAQQLHDAGFSAAALKAAGFSAKELHDAGYSAAQLKAAGFSAGALKAAGFDAAQLKNAGFSAAQLHNAGFTASDLKAAGFTAKQLTKAGFTGGDLLRAGFSPKEAGMVDPTATTAASADDSLPVRSQPKELDVGDSGASIPSIDGSSQAAQIRALQEAQQQMMSQQQKADATQQMQGQMMMMATKVMGNWSNPGVQTVQRAPEDKTMATTAAAAGTALTGPIIKAGTVMFGVLDTSLNSDEANTPVMATIVSGQLKGAKLMGRFTRVDKRLLLNFNLVNVASFPKSFAANIVAIDPNTARTALSGYVNNHYLLRYGSLFASSFLSGLSKGIMQSNTNQSCLGPFCFTSYKNLTPTEYVAVGLGQAGQQYASSMSSNFNVPPTVKIPSGVGVGLLFMADTTLPQPLPEKNYYGSSNTDNSDGGE